MVSNPAKIEHSAGSLTPEFIEIAENLGQDVRLLELGEPQVEYVRILTLEEARRILSRASPEERIERSKTFLNGLEYRSRIGQGMHDRGEAYFFAAHSIDNRDAAGHKNHLPLYARIMSVPKKTIPPGEVWDMTLRPEEWNVHRREEMYNIINLGTLILEPGSRLIVRGNVLAFTCQEFIKKGVRMDIADIEILGTPHGFGNDRDYFDGLPARPGSDGKSGQDGLGPRPGSSILGPVLDSTFVSGQMDAAPGCDGEHGRHGEAGLNGGACRIAEINIRSLKTDSPLAIAVVPGNGGNGGRGGAGGNGGNGGNGIDAIKTIEGLLGPGKGGAGGKGGNGGRGGRAGHGGISSNVFITVPDSEADSLRCYSKTGYPGIPGTGGPAGRGGMGGKNGAGPNGGSGEPAPNGKNGGPGTGGRPGKTFPSAKIYINNSLLQPTR